MKILIMGAGRVGTSVAENLVSEENDITVVDSDPTQLQSVSYTHLTLPTTPYV